MLDCILVQTNGMPVNLLVLNVGNEGMIHKNYLKLIPATPFPSIPCVQHQ